MASQQFNSPDTPVIESIVKLKRNQSHAISREYMGYVYVVNRIAYWANGYIAVREYGGELPDGCYVVAKGLREKNNMDFSDKIRDVFIQFTRDLSERDEIVVQGENLYELARSKREDYLMSLELGVEEVSLNPIHVFDLTRKLRKYNVVVNCISEGSPVSFTWYYGSALIMQTDRRQK